MVCAGYGGDDDQDEDDWEGDDEDDNRIGSILATDVAQR